MRHSLLIGEAFDRIVRALTEKETDHEKFIRNYFERRRKLDESNQRNLNR